MAAIDAYALLRDDVAFHAAAALRCLIAAAAGDYYFDTLRHALLPPMPPPRPRHTLRMLAEIFAPDTLLMILIRRYADAMLYFSSRVPCNERRRYCMLIDAAHV